MTAGPEAAGTCKVRLTEKLIRSLRVTQVIDCGRTCEGGEDAQTQPRSLWQVTSADWSQDGTTVVLALCPSAKGDARWPPSTGAANVGNPREGRSDERCAKLLFFSAHTGSLTQIRETTWRNIDAVRFVQGGARKCLVACSDSRPAVVLWSLDDNVLPTHYSLPAAVVPHTGVDVHPTGDLFLASCLDGTVLLFHLDRAQALGHVRGSSSYPVSAFDCEGLVYACSLGNRKIHLFGCDDDAIDKEPAGQFSSFDLSPFLAPGSHITSLAFGPDEKTLLVCSNRAQVLLIDAFDGKKSRAAYYLSGSLLLFEGAAWLFVSQERREKGGGKKALLIRPPRVLDWKSWRAGTRGNRHKGSKDRGRRSDAGACGRRRSQSGEGPFRSRGGFVSLDLPRPKKAKVANGKD
ncbi:putative WD-40 repeat-containing protein [Neospora caninum Liverpool]|uniref:Putative WD-40 repeat-containing protein n=1 Tax=Neospora caninum (strain Liverpool) TaxID=572307 RepID=F0VNE4_NEOCL|nr:putative WD-40 repeat-containing protein [Neospora caninum Liverpool]CBZ55240.1 putative WD-40 repeat-containing protein [Neospora caninum Liverpool]|eukprot:XP_003885268.1 putative WD-40 repeat-containing protein [Neospora caninum Liverpool]